MTSEEAIEHLKKNYLTMLDNKEFYKEKHIESIGIAIKALEKQIPKKPIKNYAMVNLYYCPTCSAWFTGRSKTHHCVCGQTLDWGEEE